MTDQEQVQIYQEQLKDASAQEVINWAAGEFGEKCAFATSLGEEDQVLLDMIAGTAPNIKVFTLDTGRLFQETYDLLARNQKRYDIDIDIYYPDTKALEGMVREKGINLFYESVENRKLCCGIRKVEPLRRALEGKRAWITGLRRDQALTRSALEVVEWDEGNRLIKISPLARWSLKDVRQYIDANQLDINPLHKKGFVSIGCAPCTRAIEKGEDIRNGRWWWEQPEQKECGLHQRIEKKTGS